MNKHANTIAIVPDVIPSVIPAIVLALALIVVFSANLQADEPTEWKPTINANVMKCCQDMKALRVKMVEDMKAQDKELTEQLAAMNSAPEKEKVILLTTVINLMGKQRIAMRAQRAQLEEQMSKHMREHINMGSKPPHPMMDMKSGQGTRNIVDGTQSDQ